MKLRLILESRVMDSESGELIEIIHKTHDIEIPDEVITRYKSWSNYRFRVIASEELPDPAPTNPKMEG